MPGPGSQPVPKPRSAVDKREKRSALVRQWRRIRQAVLTRDGWRCRVCLSRELVDAHHIKFRSAGGEDNTSNVAALCRICHDAIHSYRLSLKGDADGKLWVTRVKV